MKLLFRNEDDSGFTLLEMLIATMVISMIILSSHTLLEQLIVTGKRQISYSVKLTEIIRVRTLFERDLQGIMIDEKHPLITRQQHDDCTEQVSFYTHNVANPDNAMGEALLKLTWSEKNGVLKRRQSEYKEGEAFENIIINDVRCLQFREYTEGQWTDNPHSQNHRPDGIAFKIIYKSGFSFEGIIPE